MFYESELRFLCDTFKKCRVPVSFIHPEESAEKLLDESIKRLFSQLPDMNISMEMLFGHIQPYTVYKTTNSISLCFMYLLLPQTEGKTAMVIGPYLSVAADSKQIFAIGEKHGVPPQKQKLLEAYYGGLPVLQDSSPLFALLDTFCEHIWGGSNSFRVVDINRELLPEGVPLQAGRNTDPEDLLINMELMEQRYAFENELIQAVSRGQTHKGALILERFNETTFEHRLSDPLRNLKNYSIIMNTLLRKAAEQGGVHPLYLNDISSGFAVRIEQLGSQTAVYALMNEMFHAYCRLVRKHSMKNYSSTVQKVILYIDADLSANLSLSRLARLQNISPGYLSAVFKKETGQTLTAYILRERMHLAMHLLRTTNLQIQTVALHCGIMDVQYFSKLFKKYTQKTPKEYRASAE